MDAASHILPTTYETREQRVRRELQEAGVTSYGLLKFASRYLAKVMHENERIEAAVYGRYQEAPGWLSLSEGWLVATDFRVMFLDHKPGFTHMTELGYDIVAGVQMIQAWPSSSIILNTKVGSFTIRFANRKCIDRFMDAIEMRRLQKSREGMFLRPGGSLHEPEPQPRVVPSYLKADIDSETLRQLKAHDTGVLSTFGKSGEVHGAAVYYMTEDDGTIYVLTKGDTRKALDILSYPQVSLTIFDTAAAQTIQLQGICEVETDPATRDRVFWNLTKPRSYGNTSALPPVVSLQSGMFTILRITPSKARFIDYLKSKTA